MSQIIDKLSAAESKILPLLLQTTNFSELVEISKLNETQVMRLLQWLENKGLLKISKQPVDMVDLGELGVKYRKLELPEKRFLKAIVKDTPLQEIMKVQQKLKNLLPVESLPLQQTSL